MVVGEIIKLGPIKSICQEAENLHVCELDVFLVLMNCILFLIEVQDAFGDTNVSCLLRLVFEFDHASWNIV